MLYTIIMAGGTGERIWPRSREKMPKQFLNLIKVKKPGEIGMIQETINRIKPLVTRERILIVTNKNQAGFLRKQLVGSKKSHGIKEKNIIVEPVGRNTASCIGLAAISLRKRAPEGTMVILPSDHLIKEKKQFLDAVLTAEKAAQPENSLVTIGIEPTYPSTGYGYIKITSNLQLKVRNKKQTIYKVGKFVEKPDKRTAESFLKSERYFWNSGIFVWKVSSILNAIEKYMPKLYSGLEKIEAAIGTRNYQSCLQNIYPKLEKISIDYGVMERAKSVFLVKTKFTWEDMGSWNSLENIIHKDKDNNIILGHHEGLDTKDSIIVSEDGCLVGTIGISNLIIVKTKDAALVCRKDRAEDVKKLVTELRKNKKFKKYL